MRTAWFLIILFSLSGCALFSGHKKELAAERLKVQRLNAEIRKKNQQITDLKEKNMVLAQRSVMQAGGDDIAAVPPSFVDQPVAESEIVTELPSAISRQDVWISPRTQAVPSSASKLGSDNLSLSQNSGEHLLYTKVLSAYRQKNRLDLEKATELLLKAYPNSSFADNALYVNALEAFEVNQFASALKYLTQLEQQYPMSNKIVTSIFTRAVIYKKQRQFTKARQALHRVLKEFSGSPEALRVELELKLINSLQGKGGRHAETSM